MESKIKELFCMMMFSLLILFLPIMSFDVQAATMSMSESGKIFLENHEGCALTAYKLSGEEYYTIGYGHYGSDVYFGMTITKEEADALFEEDLKEYVALVNKYLTNKGVTVTQSQFDALVSLQYNTGYGWRSTSVATIVCNGPQNYTKAQIKDAFSNCCVNVSATLKNGLLRRRADEADLFLSGTVTKTGWVSEDGNWYYLVDADTNATGWKCINSKWYYFDDSGVMQTGWKCINSKWYYFDDSGVMQTGWKSINSKWYYFDDSGVMQTGWKSINSKWYYFNSAGAMQTGWKSINSKWYYFNSSGAMQTGWKSINSKWYYFNDSGIMQTGTVTIAGKNYIFDTSGVWQS